MTADGSAQEGVRSAGGKPNGDLRRRLRRTKPARQDDPEAPPKPGRPHRLQVRLTEAEWGVVTAQAELEGVSASRLLVEGVTKRDRGTVGQQRQVIREFLSAKRQVSGVATNLNQLARVANSTGRVPAELAEGIRRVDDALALLEDAVRQMGGTST